MNAFNTKIKFVFKLNEYLVIDIDSDNRIAGHKYGSFISFPYAF